MGNRQRLPLRASFAADSTFVRTHPYEVSHAKMAIIVLINGIDSSGSDVAGGHNLRERAKVLSDHFSTDKVEIFRLLQRSG